MPKPTAAQLEEATSGERERQEGERTVTVPFKPGELAPLTRTAGSAASRPAEAEVRFPPLDGAALAVAEYP